MTDWNFADLWERVAARHGDREALVHGDDRRTWSEFDRAANGLAGTLLAAGLGRQAKVGVYLYSRPEFLETYFAAFKAGLVPINVNYRYTADEVAYIIADADSEAVVFGASFAPVVAAIRDRLPLVTTWICVAEEGAQCPPWATPYAEAARPADPPELPWQRTPDDLFFLYTGGTTGMPKGVMWRQDDVAALLGVGAPALLGGDAPQTLAEWDERVLALEVGARLVPACPLMHGTGLFTSYATLMGGGTVVLLTARSFDPVELLDVTDREGVNVWAIVGDPFARPVADALDASPGRWNLASLLAATSSGAMWSESVKQRILAHHPAMVLADAFSSSEALGMGQSLSTGAAAASTARFELGERAAVLRPDGSPVERGSGEVGIVAVHDLLPLGYYKDPDKTARTFLESDGVRYLLSGDMATVDADGTINLLGRDSVCINTGGEKVFAEEVEEALKTYPGVADALVVGVPDDKWGQAVSAVVQATRPVDEESLRAHVRERLAGYKVPKRIVQAGVPRSPSGKADFARAKEIVLRAG